MVDNCSCALAWSGVPGVRLQRSEHVAECVSIHGCVSFFRSTWMIQLAGPRVMMARRGASFLPLSRVIGPTPSGQVLLRGNCIISHVPVVDCPASHICRCCRVAENHGFLGCWRCGGGGGGRGRRKALGGGCETSMARHEVCRGGHSTPHPPFLGVLALIGREWCTTHVHAQCVCVCMCE